MKDFVRESRTLPSTLQRAIRWIEWVALAALLVFVGLQLWPQARAWAGLPEDLVASPPIEVVTLDGRSIDPAVLRGRVVVLNFWATWCLPCRVEMPALQSLHDRYAGEGLIVLGLSTDAEGEEVVRSYVEKRELTFPVALADPATRWAFGGVEKIPTTFIVDRDGVIRYKVVGYFASPGLKRAVRRLLAVSADGDN
jgi:thiol-disulfide isomerase/thioredoxin